MNISFPLSTKTRVLESEEKWYVRMTTKIDYFCPMGILWSCRIVLQWHMSGTVAFTWIVSRRVDWRLFAGWVCWQWMDGCYFMFFNKIRGTNRYCDYGRKSFHMIRVPSIIFTVSSTYTPRWWLLIGIYFFVLQRSYVFFSKSIGSNGCFHVPLLSTVSIGSHVQYYYLYSPSSRSVGFMF